MIAFHDNLPLVRLDGGQAAAFEETWLCRSLAQAAKSAGHRKWHLGEHIARSVRVFLECDFEGTTISVKHLEEAVRFVLDTLGQADISSVFRLVPPPTRIFLADVAQQAGDSCELLFFNLLRDRLREAVAEKSERIEILEARRGIKLLNRSKNWGPRCSGTLEEVIGLAQSEMLPLGDADLHISLQ